MKTEDIKFTVTTLNTPRGVFISIDDFISGFVGQEEGASILVATLLKSLVSIRKKGQE